MILSPFVARLVAGIYIKLYTTQVYNKAKTSIIDINSFSLTDEEIDLGGKYDGFVEPSLIEKEFLTDCVF